MNLSDSSDAENKAAKRSSGAPRSSAVVLRNSMLVVFAGGICALFAVWFARQPAGPSSDSTGDGAMRSLQSNDPATRVQAIREVAQSGLAESESSISAVLPALGDRDSMVRAQAAQTLGALGSYAVWAKMSGVPGADSSGESLDNTIEALSTSVVKDGDAMVRADAARALGNIAATSPRPPASNKRGRGNSSQLRAPSPSPVKYEPIVEVLIAALGDSDDDVRAAAAAALGAAGPKVSREPLPPLIAVLKDRSAVARAEAGKALPSFELGLDPVLPTLIRMANDRDPDVHRATVDALRRLKKSAISSAAIPALVEGIDNSDRQVRIYTIRLLATFGKEAKVAVPRLIAVLDEPLSSDNTTVGGGRAATTTYAGPAHEAAKALGEIVPGSPLSEKTVAALSRVVRGAARQRRSSAADALGKFGAAAAPATPDLVKMLEEATDATSMTGSSEADAATRALAKIAADAKSSNTIVTALSASLRSGSKAARVAVIETIEQLGPKAVAAAPVIESLKNDPDPNVQKAASKALKALNRT